MLKEKLIPWYLKEKRELPWRNTNNPYKIWLSEIILQQTRVEQGLDYYKRFIKAFPTVKHLANANEDEVLNLWQGLGYYSRARNLHYSAKLIVEKLGGKFPMDYHSIKELKGVGEYTAAAIASFAYDQPHAVVDGNVFRVLSRIFGIKTPIDSQEGKKEFFALAQRELDTRSPGLYNQSIMEFGATFCKPLTPPCEECIFSDKCFAFQHGMISQLPVKLKKLKQRIRHFNYLVMHNNEEVVIGKRTGRDIWNGLYDFPLIETPEASEPALVIAKSFLKKGNKSKAPVFTKMVQLPKHILSHQVIFPQFIELKFKGNFAEVPKGYKKIAMKDLGKYPVPRLIERYLEQKSW